MDLKEFQKKSIEVKNLYEQLEKRFPEKAGHEENFRER